jgi:glycosyltransferase involved in cell wall biosynthesis
MSAVTVSIIIPFIDEYDFLQEAIACAMAQEAGDKEIIVVCNAAKVSDNFHALQKQFPAVRFIHEPTPGSAFARNAGLAASHGEWIQYLDVDDLLQDHKIARQLALTDADVVLSPHRYQFVSGKKIDSSWSPEDIWAGLLGGHLGSTSSWLWKRQALLEVNGWNESFYKNQEYELLFRLMKAGSHIACCPDHLTIVRERRQGSITKATRHRPWAGITLRRNIWNYLLQEGMATPERFETFRKFIFKSIRALYQVNPDEARALHHQYFAEPAYQPVIPHIPMYGRMYKWLGFENTEKLIGQYRYLRDAIIKIWPFASS